MKRELRDVLRMLAELEQALRNEEKRVLTLGREIKDLTSLLERLEGEKREAEKQAMTSGHSSAATGSGDARESASVLQTSGRNCSGWHGGAQREGIAAGQFNAQIAEAEQSRAELELAAAAGSATSGWTAQAARCWQRRTLRSDWPAWPPSKSGIARRRPCLERIESLVAEMCQRVASLRSRLNPPSAEKLQREARKPGNRRQNRRISTPSSNAGETRDRPVAVESEQVRSRLAEIDATAAQRPPVAGPVTRPPWRASGDRAKLQSDAQYMAETCLNELGVQRQELMADTTIRVVSGEQLAMEDPVYREMRTRLDAMGPVNMMALEEYKETAERHAFLETQRRTCSSPSRTRRPRSRKSTRSHARNLKRRSTRSTRTFRPRFTNCSAAAMLSCG